MSVKKIGNGLVKVWVSQEGLEDSIAALEQLKPILLSIVIQGNGDNIEQAKIDSMELTEHLDTAIDAMKMLLSGFSDYKN